MGAPTAVDVGIPIPLNGSVPYMQLPVPLVPQPPGSELCWAACCAMIINAESRSNVATALSVAGELLGTPVNPYQTEDPGVALNCYRIPYDQATVVSGCRFYTPQLLAGYVAAGRPIELWWQYVQAPQSGHVSLVTGYSEYQNGVFCVADPMDSSFAWLTYGALATFNGTRAVWDTYVNIGNSLLPPPAA